MYELEDPGAPDVPTTLRRSKEDCPKVGMLRLLLCQGTPCCFGHLRGLLGLLGCGWPHSMSAYLMARVVLVE